MDLLSIPLRILCYHGESDVIPGRQCAADGAEEQSTAIREFLKEMDWLRAILREQIMKTVVRISNRKDSKF